MTAQSLEINIVTEKYNLNELSDMLVVHGAANQSGRRAARMYAERIITTTKRRVALFRCEIEHTLINKNICFGIL